MKLNVKHLIVCIVILLISGQIMNYGYKLSIKYKTLSEENQDIKAELKDIYNILSHREKVAKTALDRESYLLKHIEFIERQLSISNLRISFLENQGVSVKGE